MSKQSYTVQAINQTINGFDSTEYGITNASGVRVATCYWPDSADSVCRLMSLGDDYGRLAKVNAQLMAALERIANSKTMDDEKLRRIAREAVAEFKGATP